MSKNVLFLCCYFIGCSRVWILMKMMPWVMKRTDVCNTSVCFICLQFLTLTTQTAYGFSQHHLSPSLIRHLLCQNISVISNGWLASREWLQADKAHYLTPYRSQILRASIFLKEYSWRECERVYQKLMGYSLFRWLEQIMLVCFINLNIKRKFRDPGVKSYNQEQRTTFWDNVYTISCLSFRITLIMMS